MKQVVNSVDTARVAVKFADPTKFYAVKFGESEAGIITRSAYKRGNFIVVSTDNFTNGNCWSGNYNHDSLADFIKSLIAANNKVFEFDTFREFSEWIIKTNNLDDI
jgi:hypothetical protein